MTIRRPASRRFISKLAMVAAITGMGATMAVVPATPAFAKKEKEAKPQYSKEFIEAYKPYEAAAKAETPDVAAQQAALPQIIALASSPDEKLVAGQAAINVGGANKDMATQYKGTQLMLESGKLPPESVGQVNYAAGQLAYNLKDFAAAQNYLRTAIDGGYAAEEGPLILAETYFQQKDINGGLNYLNGMIEARKAAGQPIQEDWLSRGFSMAYNNKLNDQALKWATLRATEFPSKDSWGNAIALAINTNDYDKPAMLDLLRLARRTDTLRNGNMYMEYADAADARKLPQEVVTLLDAGTKAGVISGDTALVQEWRKQAATRLAADKGDLPGLVRDANASGAKLVTVMAAADTLLSYGRSAEAEGLYAKALPMAGAMAPTVLTRMGIAQIDQGKYGEAETTFERVDGARQTIANLWALYATQQAS